MLPTLSDTHEAMKQEGHHLNKSGWIDSYMTRKAIDGDGNPVPWYTYAFTYFLKPRLTKDMRVFEYGSGYSTVWYSKLVKSVHSVDDKQPWIDRVKEMVADNVNLYHRTGDKYAEIILNLGLFDIIVIDGEDRVKCTEHAVNQLTDNGVIIWDNSNCAPKDLLKEWKRLDFVGLIPICVEEGYTSVFYRDNNCLGI
jgi:hypothetical protein